MNLFRPARALNRRAPSIAVVTENEMRTAVQAYAGLLHVISTIKTHYIVLPTQEPDEAILIGLYRCSEPVCRRVKSILHDRGYWGVQSTDIRAYFSSVAKADESWLLEIVQSESRHLFGTEPHMELIDAQTSNMDARERRVLQGFAERRKEDRQQLVKAVTQGAYTAAGEWLSKLLDWKLDTPMRMQCAPATNCFCRQCCKILRWSRLRRRSCITFGCARRKAFRAEKRCSRCWRSIARWCAGRR